MLSLALAAAFSVPPVNGQTLPSGGVAVHGQAAFSSPSPQQLVVTTQNGPGSGHSAINWQSFSISAGSSARINQPDATSLSINRVVTHNPSAIFGNLSSNGRLVLVNPSGITVGAGAIIDTAGFTASALRMSDADALAGRLRFGDAVTTMGGAAGITVEGRITARDGDIVLVAPQIAVGSSALLQAPNGSTILAAGQMVEITGRGLEGITMLVQARDNEARNLGRLEGDAVGIFAGTLRHSGEIQATTASFDGGRVVLLAVGDAYLEGDSTVIATGRRGGQVDVFGERVAVTEKALVDVSGSEGGGRIRIGGDFQGRNQDLTNADKTYLGSDTTLRADATASGDGGRVIVWSDTLTKAHGKVSARGGPHGGSGGFVEISGKQQLVFDGAVDLLATRGLTGTLLLDPDFIDVAIGGTSLIGDVNLFGVNPGQLLTISPATLNAVGGNVMLQATQDINFFDPVNLTTAGASLTALAGGFITVSASITTNGGAITLYANAPGSGGPGSGGSAVYVNAPITSNGGSITLQSDASDVGGNAVYLQSSVNAGSGTMLINAAGTLTLQGGGGSPTTLVSTGDQTITATDIDVIGGTGGSNASASISMLGTTATQTITANNGITITGGANGGGVGAGNSATIASNGHQLIAVGNGGLTLTAGGGTGAQTGNSANVEHNGGAGTSQTITINGSGFISATGGSSALTGMSEQDASRASIRSDNGDSQAITFTGGGAGRGITLTGGTNGSDAYAEIYAGLGTQTITGAGLITLTGGASGGGLTDGLGTHGNLAVINADLNDQTIGADGIVLQGGAGGINNLAALVSSGNQAITVGSGGLSLTGGSGGAGENKNAAFVIKTSDVPATTQVITIGGGGAITMLGGSSSDINVGFDSNLLGLGNGSMAMIRSDGVSQLIEFTGVGSIIMTGGTVGSNNFANILAATGTQTIRGSIAANAPTISLIGGLSGGVTGEGNRALIGSETGTQVVTAASISITGGAAGTENLAQIRQGGVSAGLAESQTVTIVGGGNLALMGGGGATNLARIQSYGVSQTVDMGAGGALDLTGGTGSGFNFARIEALNGDQFINGSAAITITGGASGGAAGTGNFADIRQRNVARLQSVSADTLDITGGAAGIENNAAIRGNGNQSVSANVITIQGGSSGTDNYGQINAINSSQTINVGSGGISLTGGGGISTDRRNYASVYQGGFSGTSQTVIVGGGGAIDLQGGSSAGTNVGADNGSLAFITSEGDSQLVEFTGTGSTISITGGSVGSNNSAGIVARNGSQIVRGSIAAHAPSFTLFGGSGGVAGEGNGAQIAAANGSQTISALGASLNGGSGADSFAVIASPNQSLVFNGNVGLDAAGATGDGGTRIGGRPGASGSNTNLTMTVSGNLSLIAGPAVGAAIGTTSNATGLSNDITATIGGTLTLSPSAGAGVRIGSRGVDVNGGTIAITAGSILMNAGDGVSNVAGIRTLGNLTLTSTTGGITEAADTNIRANLLTVSSAGAILMDSLANRVSFLNANVQGFDTGDLFFTVGGPFALLNLSGITMAGTKTARITADDIDISGTVSNVGGTVILRPLNLAGGIRIDSIDLVLGEMNLTPAELQLVTNASVLEIGRLDGTGNLNLVSGLPNNSNNVGTLRLLAGQDFYSNSGASVGDFVTPFSHHLQVRANRDLQITNGNMFMANNRNLLLYADDDGIGGGAVSIGSAILGVGDAGNASGSMDIKGSAINVAVSGATSASLNVFGAGNQTFTATTGDLRFENNNNGSNLGVIQIGTKNGTQSLAASGLVRLQAGGVTSNSTSVSGDAAQIINAAQLQLVGGGSGTTNVAQIIGGTQTMAIGAGGIGLTAGAGASGNSAQIFQSSATGTQTISSAGNIQIDAGSGAGSGNFAQIVASGTGGQTVNLTTGGNITLTGGTSGSRNYAGILTDGGSQSISGATNIFLYGGASGGGVPVGGTSEGNRAFISAATSQTISVLDSITLEGGASGADNYARIGLFGVGALMQTITAGNGINLTGGLDGGGVLIAGNVNLGNGAYLNSQGSQSVEVGAGGVTMLAGSGSLTNNQAQIFQSGTTGTSQTITVNAGGSITLVGGDSSGTNVGSPNGARAILQNNGDSQLIDFTAGGSLSLQGGSVGSRNFALIHAANGSQTVQGANTITLMGGIDGLAGEGNWAQIFTDVGAQNISAGSIFLLGGSGGIESFAAIRQGTSSIATTAAQNITIANSGSLALLGGDGTTSFARIQSFGSAQSLTFGSGSILNLQGGNGVSDSFARIQAVNGSQMITGAPNISIVGGTGGTDLKGNPADIRADAAGASQSIAAGSMNLTAGDSGEQNYAGVFAANQVITVASNLSLTGGGSVASLDGTVGGGARIGARGNTAPTSLSLTVGNDLTITGGSVAGAAIGSDRQGGQPTTIVISAGGNVSLNPGTAPTAGVRIGSPLSNLAGGDIFVSAGGTIALNGVGANETMISTLGDVTLSGSSLVLNNRVTGSTIVARSTSGGVSIGGAGVLSASASSGDAIEVVSAGTFINSAGSGALSVTSPARWLVYSSDPSLDARGGLVYGFKQYAKAFLDANPILGAGNGFLYTLAPTATVNLTGVASKVYDGTNVATLAAGNFTALGGIDGDVVSVSSSASGTYDTRHVGGGKTVSVSSLTIDAIDGTAPVFGYALSGGMATAAIGTITAAALSVTTADVNKVYDSTTAAAGTPVISSGTLFAGDTLNAGTYAFLNPNAGTGKTVTVSGFSVNDGNSGANYTLTQVNNTTSSITALATATWLGSAGDSLWSNASNWDVAPETGNVLGVTIPSGTGSVIFDATAGTTSLQRLTSARPVSLTGGNLQIGTLLQTASYSQSGTSSLSGTGSLIVTDSFSQTGGTIDLGAISINQAAGNLNVGNLSAPVITLSAPTGMITQSGSLTGDGALVAASQTGSFLTGTGNQVGALSATNAGPGDIMFVNTGTLAIQLLANAGGNIDVVNTGGVTTSEAVSARAGNVFITANSPLTIGAGGIVAGGDIVLNATNLTSAGDLTLNGVLTAGNTVSLTAGNAMVQNFAVFGANGVTADAGTSMLYGPFAITNNPPVRYSVAGLSVTPPPTVLASSLQAPGDLLVTFLDLFQQAINGNLGAALELDADGNLRRKLVDGLVSEEELCR